MKSHARAVVIGGGVVGCSVLYHLVKLGWRDVVLLERSELTAGSTWHAAGGMHTLNGDPSVASLQAYTINLYREIERESGIACGIHQTGCLYLAANEREIEFFRADFVLANSDGLVDNFVNIDIGQVQLEFSIGNASEIEQIVNDPRFQLDTAPEHLHVAV